MGQKTNSNIFRLGITKTWKTEFFEKKSEELALYIYKDLEIKNYIHRFFETQGLFIYDYRQTFNNNNLNLHISYLITSSFAINKKTFVCKDLILLTKTKKKLIKNSESSNKIINIFDQLIEVLNLFFKTPLNITINLCCLNKNITTFLNKKYLIQLRKYKKTSFFKDGIEIMLHTIVNKNSANLLAKFIANEIKKTKRHKFLLAFLKRTLTILINSDNSKIKGVKIILKGRINGVPRSSHKIITVGQIPTQSFNNYLDFSQTSCHNNNGSYGIKVWIH